jgi:hypothetical protein
MKKFIALLLSLLLAAGSLSCLAFDDVPEDASYKQAVENLQAYGIFSGKTAELFDPDAFLTRAEFAKLAVLISGGGQQKTGALFSDVPASHWANGYIAAAAEQGLLIAYPDGRFDPDASITFAQAATVTLRLRGYSDGVISGAWPADYLAKAEELGITDGVSCASGQAITRAQCAVLLNNALVTGTYEASSSGSGSLLLEKMGLSLTDECIVYADKAESAALLENQVLTTLGTYAALTDSAAFLSQKGKLVLDEDGAIVWFLPSEQTSEKTTSSKIGSHLYFSDERSLADLDDDCIVFYNGRQWSYQSLCDDSDVSWSGKDTILYHTAGGAVDYVFASRQ